ncbi:MAG: hypothetical protein LBC74_11210 [Planctomycetaceae bacterium]|jgi:hypothetical protein|nr:hypothetical protein [Planctomycetaceae bacterium]
MKKFLFEPICSIFVPIMMIVGVVSVFAQSNINVNDSLINKELVPIWISHFSQADSVLPYVDPELLSGEFKRFRKNSDLTESNFDSAIKPTNNYTGNSTINDEVQFGNELRKILAQKPEIPPEKIPTLNRTEINHASNYRNNKSAISNDTPQEIVRAQSVEDPLVTRPEPPQGRSPDLSSIPTALLTDPNTDPKTVNPNINTTSPYHIHNSNSNETINPDNKQKNETKNQHPKNQPLLERNDLASVVNGWLLVATIVSVATLVYVAIIAVDYHQRWMQTLTAQNDRYFVAEDSAYNGLTDMYDAPEKNRFGTDFFTYPAI